MPGQRDEIPISTLEAWGLAPGNRVWVGGNNASARGAVEALLPEDIERPPTGPIDLALITPQSSEEGVYFARKLRARLEEDSSLWIVFPKFGTKHEVEFSGSLDEMIIGLFELGFMETARAPVGEDYISTGFRLADAAR